MSDQRPAPQGSDPAERLLVLGPLILVGGAILIGIILSDVSSAALAFAIVFPIALVLLTVAVATGIAIARFLNSR